MYNIVRIYPQPDFYEKYSENNFSKLLAIQFSLLSQGLIISDRSTFPVWQLAPVSSNIYNINEP